MDCVLCINGLYDLEYICHSDKEIHSPIRRFIYRYYKHNYWLYYSSRYFLRRCMATQMEYGFNN